MLKIFSQLNKGDERTSLLNKNILFNSLIKGGSILISFLLVPICIKYVGEDNYGIWLTLSSVVVWLAFFDIGLTNGLRNRYAEAKAQNDLPLMQEYVSTTFFIISLIFFVVWIIVMIINVFIDWTVFFKTVDFSNVNNLSLLFAIIISYFCLLSVTKVLGTILIADQRPAIVAFVDVIGQFLSLIVIVIMTRMEPGTIIKMGVVLCLCPLVVWIAANIFIFNLDNYKKIIPHFKFVKLSRIKDIMDLGGKFFVIQIAALVQYQTANFIIAYFYSEADVTYFNLAFKYFSAITMLFGLFLTPLWSAVTDAYTKKEYKWIKDSVKRFLLLATVVSLLAVIMLLFNRFAFNIWVGKEISEKIQLSLLVWCCLYTLITLYTAIFVNILNGMGILNMQFRLSLISPVLYVGIVYFFVVKLNLGVYSLFIALILTNLNGYIAPLQYIKIIKRK